MEKIDAEKVHNEYTDKIEKEIRKNAKLNRTTDLITSASVVAVVGALTALVGIGTAILPDLWGNKTSFVSIIPNTSKSIADISTSLNQTQNDVNNVKTYYQYLVDNLKTSTSSAELKSVEARVTQLENKEDALSQTIVDDPDKALTARFLREKQKELEAELGDIKAAEVHLNDRIDGLMFGGVVTIIVTLVLGLIGFCYKVIFAKNDSK